ncbi:MAG TPA: CAP domain-containing protein [Bryobacteraceae bacterium]|jgi:uncharacterized protein YkwD
MHKYLLAVIAVITAAFAAGPGDALPEFSQQILAAHNAVRGKVGVPPLKWSDKLAARAAEWANTLVKTGASRMQGVPGQNIAYTSPPGTAKAHDIVAAWAAEAANYNHEKNACIEGKRCHHFTQVVWRNSSFLGCATAHDSQRDIWVCDYDPPGNNMAEKPY